MNEVNYELQNPFKYAFKGDQVDASFITLYAPTYKSMENFLPIKQAFTSAVTELSASDLAKAEKDSDESQDIDAKAVIQVLYAWSGDMHKVFLHAEKLFRGGAAKVEGETSFTAPMLDKMDLVDVEGLIGTYIANFIAKSLMDGTE